MATERWFYSQEKPFVSVQFQRIAWLFGVAVVLASSSRRSLAADPVMVGRKVPVADRVLANDVRHDLWNQLLQQYVDRTGRVNYATWNSTPADLQALEDYLAELSRANHQVATEKAAKLAYWINAYNALTIHGILREYPTSSIRNHTAKVFGYNIWKDLRLIVGDVNYSLDHIEHQILRKLGEPRIHFAIVCASLGCPRLLNEAYEAQRLDQQLTTNTRMFFSTSANFQYDARRQVIHLSSILDWFQTDFGVDQAAMLKYVSSYLPTRPARQAANSGTVEVRFLDYDWNLNDQNTVGSQRFGQ